LSLPIGLGSNMQVKMTDTDACLPILMALILLVGLISGMVAYN
jgi:hypothetical protein